MGPLQRKSPAVALLLRAYSPRSEAIWPGGYKTFSMLNLTEHGFYPAHDVRIPTLVGILTFITSMNFKSNRLWLGPPWLNFL